MYHSLSIGGDLSIVSATEEALVRQLLSQMEKIVNDHENRIRVLERWVGFGLAAAFIIKWVADSYITAFRMMP